MGTTGVLAGTAGLPLGISTACGCEALGTISIKVSKGGVEVKKCEFGVINEKCQIEFKVTGGGTYEVEKNEFMGAKANERYKKTEGCKAGVTKIKEGTPCKDEIERINNEVGTENENCVTFDAGAIKPSFCTKLIMKKIKVEPKKINFAEEPKALEEAKTIEKLTITNEGPGELSEFEAVTFQFAEGAKESFVPQNKEEPCEKIAVNGKCKLFIKFIPQGGNEKFKATMATNPGSEAVTFEGKSK